MKALSVLYGLTVLVPCALVAQETPHFTFGGGAGFTTPVGTTGSNLDVGWNIRGSAGVNFNSFLGVTLDVGYDSLGVTSASLNNLGTVGEE
jgi:hypothetical protein